MIPVTASTPVMVAIAPVDFRRQMDGLIAHCRQALSADPMNGTLFIFINMVQISGKITDENGVGIGGSSIGISGTYFR